MECLAQSLGACTRGISGACFPAVIGSLRSSSVQPLGRASPGGKEQLNRSASGLLLHKAPATTRPASRRQRLRASSGRAGVVALSGDPGKAWEKEEARWVREEERWLREEKRWEREEARWAEERAASKVREAQLQAEVERLRAQVTALLQAGGMGAPGGEGWLPLQWGATDIITPPPPKPVSQLASPSPAATTTPPATPPPQTHPLQQVPPAAVVAAVASRTVGGTSNGRGATASAPENPLQNVPAAAVVAAVASRTVSGGATGGSSAAEPPSAAASLEAAWAAAAVDPARTLKSGMDGETVRILQEVLMALGYYCGEEDEEEQYYSDGTASAVKTWQASVGARETGVVTPEAMEQLWAELRRTEEQRRAVSSASASVVVDRQASPSAPASVAPATVPSVSLPETLGDLMVESERVYLLGENRWEDRSLLVSRRSESASDRERGTAAAGQSKCITCSGAKFIICLECDGTGELNVEEQFLEWADTTHCPYCVGTGNVECDACS